MSYHYNLGLFFTKVACLNMQCNAIKFPEKTYEYFELERDSNKLGSILIAQGLIRGDVLAIFNSKDYSSYALMMACIKIGVIYTNIDPDIPLERLNNILQLCTPKRIFSDSGLNIELRNRVFKIDLEIENTASLLTMHHTTDQETLAAAMRKVDGDAIVYIMFTSGSTGVPKGVAITHQNVIHFIHWGISRYKITNNDMIANVNPMFFDNSVFDFYMSLFSGACLVPVKKDIVSSAPALVDYIDTMQCTIIFAVPSFFIYLTTMHVLNQKSFKKIRIITFGGEGYPKSELKKLHDLFSSRITFINVYGPTECTCICSSYEISDKDFLDLNGLPPLGVINPNFSFLIRKIEENCNQEGELCLLGPNVGLGYYKNPDLTKSVFHAYTGDGFYRSRMYATGDIVKFENGLLYYLGRKDNQIKHMGYRIELEEIELAINLIPEVIQAAVVYQKTNPVHGKIVAYVVSQSPTNTKTLREELLRILPAYMIPNKIVLLEQLPKNPNGKIDRAKLSQEGMANQEIASI